MSILDDAIREHLELKRAHGADDAELKRLEDEAFGPPARPDEPDPFAEAPTEFMAAPEGERAESGRRVPNVADLQEAPPAPAEEPPAAEPAAMEHEIPPADSGHSTEERKAIAEQPTEMFDVEGTYEDAASEAEGPSDDELVDAELTEPRLAPVDPLAGIDDGATDEAEVAEHTADTAEALEDDEEEPADEFDEFFSEQRLSDELNQALEAPLPDEPGAPEAEEAAVVVGEDELEEEEEYEEEDSAEHPVAEDEDEHTDEHEVAGDADQETGEEDVLEKTPDFLEDAPEDDDLWFEQKPPKDFDFDD